MEGHLCGLLIYSTLRVIFNLNIRSRIDLLIVEEFLIRETLGPTTRIFGLEFFNVKILNTAQAGFIGIFEQHS